MDQSGLMGLLELYLVLILKLPTVFREIFTPFLFLPLLPLFNVSGRIEDWVISKQFLKELLIRKSIYS